MQYRTTWFYLVLSTSCLFHFCGGSNYLILTGHWSWVFVPLLWRPGLCSIELSGSTWSLVLVCSTCVLDVWVFVMYTSYTIRFGVFTIFYSSFFSDQTLSASARFSDRGPFVVRIPGSFLFTLCTLSSTSTPPLCVVVPSSGVSYICRYIKV